MLKKASKIPSRQHWLWVTGKEYYLEDDGSDRESLDPSSGEDADGWWTCHRDTRRGDLALLWRTKPKSDIGYLLEATSDAYSLSHDRYAKKQGWKYGCNHRSLFKFYRPLGIAEIRENPYLENWSALRKKFWGSAFAIPDDIWKRLTKILSKKNPLFLTVLRRTERSDTISGFIDEERLERHLAKHLEVFRPEYHLSLEDKQKVISEGRIDLFCKDAKSGRFVVVELKNVKAGRNTVGQILQYLDWVKKNEKARLAPLGFVIAPSFDNNFLSAANMVSGVRWFTFNELGLK